MATMIPTVFLPLKLRNGNKYRCLKNHVFSVVEKKWICNEFSSSRIVPCYSNYDDLQPKHSFYVSHRRLESFSKRHHISLDGLKEWIHNFYGDGTFINHNGLCFSRYQRSALDAIGAMIVQRCYLSNIWRLVMSLDKYLVFVSSSLPLSYLMMFYL